jgi:hypothetical protein
VNRQLSILLFASLLSFSCAGQDRGRLPDSISTEIDSATPASEAPAVNQAAVGTTEVSPPTDVSRPDTPIERVDSPVFRTVPDSDFSAYRKDPDFAYAYDPAYWRLRQTPSSGGLNWLDRALSSVFWRYFVYALLLGLLGVGLYRIIADNGLNLFYRSPRKAAIESGEEDPDLADQDLDVRVQEALKAGNLRLATRYLFIKTLRLMDAQELIRYQAKSTNEEYIRQLGAQDVSDRFRYLARAYEHVWYGGFNLTQPQFDRLSRYFQDFYQTITG